jgi:Lar family restriction alleviation protein
MSDEQLKPCPFCGSTDLSEDGSQWHYEILCNACLASGPIKTHIHAEPQDAIDAWNRRSEK